MGIRPTALKRPLLVLGCSVAVLSITARTTGAGWLVVVLSALLPLLAVGAVWPVLTLRRVSVAARLPAVGIAGRPVSLRLEVTGATQGVTVEPLRPRGRRVSALPPASGEMTVTPTRRGVVTDVAVEVRSAAPLGLVWWRRRLDVPLALAFEVGPAPDDVPAAEVADVDRGGEVSPRTVREYVPGDAARLVHWASTARRGELLVKELEEPAAPALVLVVDLRGPDDDAERAASRAAGLAEAALAINTPVLLGTAEPAGPRLGAVRSPQDVARRLARAVAGPPADGPVPAGAKVLRCSSADFWSPVPPQRGQS